MNLQPVTAYSARYPDKYEVDLNRLLLAHRPERFKSVSAALLLSALCVSSLTGCGKATGEAANGTTASSAAPDITLKEGPMKNGVRTMRMAPLHKSGIITYEGEITAESGLTDMMFTKKKLYAAPLGNYPAFASLTEQEAVVIIQEALKTHGLKSEASTKKVAVDGDRNKSADWTFDLSIAGAEEAVYAEIITSELLEPEKETAEWKAAGLPEASYEAAAALHKKLSKVEGDSTGAVFYLEDMISYSEEFSLQNQVDEFVEWMKTEGLI